jgi:hypothetical protein
MQPKLHLLSIIILPRSSNKLIINRDSTSQVTHNIPTLASMSSTQTQALTSTQPPPLTWPDSVSPDVWTFIERHFVLLYGSGEEDAKQWSENFSSKGKSVAFGKWFEGHEGKLKPSTFHRE